MNQSEIYTYVERYLEAQDCQILVRDPAYMTVKLSIQADKDITNRPYYWMFQERTGAEPQPMTLTFIFDEENIEESVRGELIKFGCWRLHQIFNSARTHGQFIRLYEEIDASTATQGLFPWLLLNYKISFVSDQKKDIFYPIGFNLLTGQIMNHFDEILNQYKLTPKIPDYHFTLRPIYSVKSAIQKVEEHINQYLETHDPTWAEEANQRIQDEAELITSFYTQNEEEEENMLQKRLDELEEYRPRIEVGAINVGIIYLQSNPSSKN